MLLHLFYCFANLDFTVIAPSSGENIEVWNKLEQLLSKKCKNKNTQSSDQQVFENAQEKFKILDKTLKSNSAILWAFRGGYGMDKIMPFIVKEHYSNTKTKTIIGYSDLTSLQIYFSQKYNWKNISSCMLKDCIDNKKSQKSKNAIYDYLSGKSSKLTLTKLVPLNENAKNSVTILGKTIGGNMTTIQTGIGTQWQIKTENRILFLEDVNVNGYQLDRILQHFRNIGLFNNVKAIIFGDFGNMTNNIKVLENFSNNINIPVFQTNEFGHQKENLPIGINFDGKIIKKEKYYLLEMK